MRKILNFASSAQAEVQEHMRFSGYSRGPWIPADAGKAVIPLTSKATTNPAGKASHN